jgi:hypothetical protein
LVCTALATAPEWEVVQDLDARVAANNPSYKHEFVGQGELLPDSLAHTRPG